MGLFGKKKTSAPPPASAEGRDLRNDPKYIRVFDKFGREMFVEKEVWRRDALPRSLKSNWDRPNELYSTIVVALQDGFFQEVLAAAAHLAAIDPIPTRGATVHAVVLLKLNRLDEAESVITDGLEKHGDDGPLLTNLAKVYDARGDASKADQVLWHSLEVDPNQDNAMDWYVVAQKERGGEDERLRALQRIAGLPKSWRAQLWLARTRLEHNDLQSALALYRESLANVAGEVPSMLLMQMSGDLGWHGYLADAVALTEPHFDPAVHGLAVGNNLLKAHLDLGQNEAAKHILDRLYALNRPDWRSTLQFWDTEITKAAVQSAAPPATKLEATLLALPGPVWLKEDTLAAQLFHRESSTGPHIALLASTVTLPNSAQHAQLQLTDARGRLGRGLPLFLAEQLTFRSDANATVLIQWLTGDSSGFVLGGTPFSDEYATSLRKWVSDCTHVVMPHLKIDIEPWNLELRVVDCKTAKRIVDFTETINRKALFQALPAVATKLLVELERQRIVIGQTPPPQYQIPTGHSFDSYIVRLEQLLTLRAASIRQEQTKFLHGERDFLQSSLELCIAEPRSVVLRLLLARMVAAMHRIRPDVVTEFKEKLQLLAVEHPLDEDAAKAISEILRNEL